MQCCRLRQGKPATRKRCLLIATRKINGIYQANNFTSLASKGKQPQEVHPWCTHTFPGEWAGITSSSPVIPAGVWNWAWTLLKKETSLGWLQGKSLVKSHWAEETSHAGLLTSWSRKARRRTYMSVTWICVEWLLWGDFMPGRSAEPQCQTACLAHPPGLQHILCCNMPLGAGLPFQSGWESIACGLGCVWSSVPEDLQPPQREEGGQRCLATARKENTNCVSSYHGRSLCLCPSAAPKESTRILAKP